eukprot:scaffold1973_cov399-Prasinococcus_capsulatus_cf.AAC.25
MSKSSCHIFGGRTETRGLVWRPWAVRLLRGSRRRDMLRSLSATFVPTGTREGWTGGRPSCKVGRVRSNHHGSNLLGSACQTACRVGLACLLSRVPLQHSRFCPSVDFLGVHL